MECGPGNTFRLKIEKNQNLQVFRPKKRGGRFFDIFAPSPTPPPHSPFKKIGGRASMEET